MHLLSARLSSPLLEAGSLLEKKDRVSLLKLYISSLEYQPGCLRFLRPLYLFLLLLLRLFIQRTHYHRASFFGGVWGFHFSFAGSWLACWNSIFFSTWSIHVEVGAAPPFFFFFFYISYFCHRLCFHLPVTVPTGKQDRQWNSACFIHEPRQFQSGVLLVLLAREQCLRFQVDEHAYFFDNRLDFSDEMRHVAVASFQVTVDWCADLIPSNNK